jgi:hypothetical protein
MSLVFEGRFCSTPKCSYWYYGNGDFNLSAGIGKAFPGYRHKESPTPRARGADMWNYEVRCLNPCAVAGSGRIRPLDAPGRGCKIPVFIFGNTPKILRIETDSFALVFRG